MTIHSILQNSLTGLDQLIDRLADAKAAEQAARDVRIAIEEQIIAVVGVKDEGAFTAKTDKYKVTTTGNRSYKIDPKAWAVVSGMIPDDLQPVKTKVEIDKAKLNYLANNEPQYYALATKALTITPNKPSVTFKPLEG